MGGIDEGEKNSETHTHTQQHLSVPLWACDAGRKGGLRRTPCKISHKDRRPHTIMGLRLAACPVARIPRDLVGDRYDETLAVAACLVFRV